MAESQISTAISDAVLALSAFHASVRLSTSSLSGLTGFLLIGLAAGCGVHRFGARNPGPSVIENHKYLSWVASVLGMSCIAAAYYRSQGIIWIANAHVAGALALILLRSHLKEDVLNTTSDIISSGAVVSMFILSVLMFNPYGIIGSLVYVIAGLVVGTDGNMPGTNIPRVDVFHYVLVLGNIALLMGLTQDPAPVYYRPSS